MWLDDDADEVLGYLREHARACPNCGTRPDEWAADDTAYVPDLRRCRGCEALETAREAVPEGQRGVYAVLEPRAVALARADAGDEGAVT